MKVKVSLDDEMAITHNGIVEDNAVCKELESMLNEAWTNGYINGYISVIRREPQYSEHSDEYEGSLLEEYECGYLSAIQDDVKWTRKYAWARGYIDGLKTSKLEWFDFDFLAFWATEYTGELLTQYNSGYFEGFSESFTKQRDYEWALGFLNQLRNLQPMINSFPSLEKSHHDDHGYLRYPASYEDGYETAKTFCQYDKIAEAEIAVNFTPPIQWIVGYIDGKYHREERFGLNSFNIETNRSRTIFDDYSIAYADGYKAGAGYSIRDKVEGGMKSWENNSSGTIERSEEDIKKERTWATGYIDGRLYGIQNFRSYNDAEIIIYKEGYIIGFSELQQDKNDESKNASITLCSAEINGSSDARKYDRMMNHGYDRARFHAYRKGFYREMLYKFNNTNNTTENTIECIREYLRSLDLPQSATYINNKLDAWKLGVKSGLTGNSPRPNNSVFFYAEDNSIYCLNDDSFAHNIESDLYNSYKEGCRFGYEHSPFYIWDFVYNIGFSDGEDYAFERTNEYKKSRSKYKGYALEAYDNGFSDALDSAYNEMKDEDKYGSSSYEWTKEDAWDGMTDGMYGDYKGDVDPDKFGV